MEELSGDHPYAHWLGSAVNILLYVCSITHPSTNLSICPSIHTPTDLSIYLSIYQFIHTFILPPVYPFTNPSIHPPISFVFWMHFRLSCRHEYLPSLCASACIPLTRIQFFSWLSISGKIYILWNAQLSAPFTSWQIPIPVKPKPVSWYRTFLHPRKFPQAPPLLIPPPFSHQKQSILWFFKL